MPKLAKRKLSREEKNRIKDERLIKKTVGWKSKHMVGRRMAHDEASNFEAPEGFQLEAPERVLTDDGFERLQFFRGNRLDALDDGRGEEIDHVIRKWIDTRTGEYLAFLPELQAQGFTVNEREDGTWVERQVTVEQAYVDRLEIQGRVGPMKQTDDDPNTYWRREYARRSENENPTAGTRFEDGQRNRHNPSNGDDPEDVPWKDDTDLDPFGQGVQTIEERDAEGNLHTYWLQERKVYGPLVTPDGAIYEGVVKTESVARPFSDLIIPESFDWWDVLDDHKRPIEGLTPSKFGDALWDWMPEIKRRVDELEEAEIRGHGHFPWGEPFVRVAVRIPEELKAEAWLLLAVAKYQKAEWFAFNVRGPAVPALREELEKHCRLHRSPNPTAKKDPELARACLLAQRKLKAEKKAAEERREKEPLPAPTEQERSVREEETLFPLPLGFTGLCSVCGRRIDPKRIFALRRLPFTPARAFFHCVRVEEVHTGDGVRRRRAVYCDGTDLSKTAMSEQSG